MTCSAAVSHDLRKWVTEGQERVSMPDPPLTPSTPLGPMLDQTVLDDVIQRVVEVAQPERIILFGSAAQGRMSRNSDVDLLIIKDGSDPVSLMARIYRRLHGVGVAVDAIVASPEDVERYKDAHALVFKPALCEGRVVYEAP